VSVYLCDEIEFLDASTGATSWAWDFDNDGTVDATTQNPSWTYTEAGYKTVKLVINGTDSITKTDYITILPNLGTPYTTANGGNFETNGWHFGGGIVAGSSNKWELGAPSNAISTTSSGSNVWKTDLDADLPSDDYQCGLFSPSFNMTASGTYTLSFDYRMEVEFGNAPAGAYVDYSIDGGASWSQLGTYNSSNNWYSRSNHSVVASGHAWSHTRTTYTTATQDVSSLAGNSDVRFRIVFQMQSGWGATYTADGFAVDDFALSGPANDAMGLPVETDLNATATENLGPNETVTFISGDCEILAVIQNLSSHDYGPTTVTIDNAGTSTQNFSTNTAASKQIADKTLTVVPTTNNTSGSYTITTYFSAAEATAWKTNTGEFLKDFNQVKSPVSISTGTIANSEYGSSPSIDSTYNGSALAVTATYSTGFSGFGGGLNGANGPLPLNLLSFAGKWAEKDAQLSWTTSQEVNVSHFEIQRYTNGDFITLGQVSANGNSNSISNYNYIDTKVDPSSGSRILYRLKITDFDGSSEYSNVITLRTNDIETTISLYPLPASGILNVSANNYDGEFSLEIINVSGQTVVSRDRITKSSKIDISQLRNGTYFVSLTMDNNVKQVKKIVVTN